MPDRQTILDKVTAVLDCYTGDLEGLDDAMIKCIASDIADSLERN